MREDCAHRSPCSCNVDGLAGAGECQVTSLSLCAFVCLRTFVCITISVCGHMSRKAAAGPHRFHALFSHLFTYPLQLASLLSALLLLFFFFWSIAPSKRLTSVTSSRAGSRRRPGEKWPSRECCVSASRDKVGFNLHQWVWLGVDGEGRVCCRLHKTLGVC